MSGAWKTPPPLSSVFRSRAIQGLLPSARRSAESLRAASRQFQKPPDLKSALCSSRHAMAGDRSRLPFSSDFISCPDFDDVDSAARGRESSAEALYFSLRPEPFNERRQAE